jgi:hypothetical protein
MIQHPETTMPEDRLRNAYADLLLTLARDEPEALERAARTLAGDAARHVAALPDGSPGAQLARAYLAFTGNQAPTAPGEGMQVFTFTYPAHVVFQIIGAGGPKAAASRPAQPGGHAGVRRARGRDQRTAAGGTGDLQRVRLARLAFWRCGRAGVGGDRLTSTPPATAKPEP